MQDNPVVAVACSDLHISARCPVARSKEPSWKEALLRPVREIVQVCRKHRAPLLIAGDLFDKWNASAEAINWFLEGLGDEVDVYAIPGNHDLPNHRPELMHRSAFGTLVASGRVEVVGPDPHFLPTSKGVALYLYGHELGGRTPVPMQAKYMPKVLHVLLTHQYLWIPGTGHVGADNRERLNLSHMKKFQGFDAVFVGDNHVAFRRGNVFNCGTTIRRKVSEVAYAPRVGLLRANGDIDSYLLPTAKDIIATTTEHQEKDDSEIEAFVGELAELACSSLDFRDSIVRAIKEDKVAQAVKDALLEAME